MSRFFSDKFSNLTPYTPGEQPRDNNYIKLNTNESPFPPAPEAIKAAAAAAETMRLYPDPECHDLTRAMAAAYGVAADELLLTNGSDEALNFAFMAFCDEKRPAAFPNITYGFYPVFALVNNVPYREIPLMADYSLRVEDYLGIGHNIFIPNPNAPTGIPLPLADIRRILEANPDNLVVIDETYVDFGTESCVPLIREYDNLLVSQTFSKSRSLAGARLGFAIGCRELIADLNTIKYSTNPYNINRMTMAAGMGALADGGYAKANCRTIMENRSYTVAELKKLGFSMTESSANFIFVWHEKMGGGELYRRLKAAGILVRHFDLPIIDDCLRITIGTREQMEALVAAVTKILEG